TKMKLLLLSLGLTLICAHTEGTHDAVTSNFDPSKYSGEWYSILLASDHKEKIEENGSMRVFVEYIHALKNSSLGFKFHIIIGKKFSLLPTNQRSSELYSVFFTDDGHNTFKVLETDYCNHIILYLINENHGNTVQLMQLYGRAPDVSSEVKHKFVNVCEKYGIVKENILDLTTVGNLCLSGRALA
uniref:Lipocalin/cytosolic fatty-acid binding domain-containing protein n=1 Tax=Spermophilus dauricus TaxID=99837 RepID=A0A8C9PK96_SPEDA